MTEKKREKTIEIKVGLDENNHPKEITWKSDDHPDGEKWQNAKGMLVSFFDSEYLDTFKLDLWTSEMQVAEMDRFIFQTIRGLADTYHKATRNTEMANDMQRFVQYFGEKTKIIPGKDS
jgi:gliding motility-associated protein GldC